jgi:hypothetical protein
MSHDIVCTLFEGDYSIGAAALINSLHRSGFDGILVCGYRGKLPPWHRDIERALPIHVQFRQIVTEDHLTYYKPRFLLDSLESSSVTPQHLTYIDPDVIVKAEWTLISRWCADGIGLVQDVNGQIPARHPARLVWRDFLETHGYRLHRELDVYYNAGFVGLPIHLFGMLETWQYLVDEARDLMGELTTLKNARHDRLFRDADQDALNMALELGAWPINGVGPQEMDFSYGGELMSHAIGIPKPWHGKYIRQSMRGLPPSRATRAFLQHTRDPLPAITHAKHNSHIVAARVAGLMGRLYRRP